MGGACNSGSKNPAKKVSRFGRKRRGFSKEKKWKLGKEGRKGRVGSPSGVEDRPQMSTSWQVTQKKYYAGPACPKQR